MTSKKTFLKLLKKNRIRKRIIDSFDNLNQRDFFDSIFRKKLYTEETIPIGHRENSDPPIALAKMLHYLPPKKGMRVLEIGTGSGYSTALLSLLANEVITIEYHEALARSAKERLLDLKFDNVRFFSGEGTSYQEPLGVFDSIIIFAGCQKRPLSLLGSLKDDGTIIFPMGPLHQQQIAVLEKGYDNDSGDTNKTHFYEFFTFLPIKGMYGIVQKVRTINF